MQTRSVQPTEVESVGHGANAAGQQNLGFVFDTIGDKNWRDAWIAANNPSSTDEYDADAEDQAYWEDLRAKMPRIYDLIEDGWTGMEDIHWGLFQA